MDHNYYDHQSVIVIVGGMGPLAGIQCFKYVVENTITDGSDQDNINTMVISYPKLIPNRTDYVLHGQGINPARSVVHFLEPQLLLLQTMYKRVIVGVPCVTFHCDAIFSLFQKTLQDAFPKVEIVSIIQSTVEFVFDAIPHIRKVGLLSTEGTRQSKPFQKELQKRGINLVYLKDCQQSTVTNCIYNSMWGLKSQSSNLTRIRKDLFFIIEELINESCEAIILGCTELPLAITEKLYKNVIIINPSWLLARDLVKAVEPSKVRSIVD